MKLKQEITHIKIHIIFRYVYVYVYFCMYIPYVLLTYVFFFAKPEKFFNNRKSTIELKTVRRT